MTKNLKQNLLSVLVFTLGFSQILNSQSLYKINDSKDMHMKLSGTSTLHKWTMNARTFTGEAEFVFAPGNSSQLASLDYLTFSLVVKNLKSDEKKLEKNAYKALKTDQYKDISYELKSSRVLPEKNNKYLIQTSGNLSIAGITKLVTMDVSCVVNKNKTITCTGSDKLKMSDYQVKPPSFMLGAMKTGDAIGLDFTMVFKKYPLDRN